MSPLLGTEGRHNKDYIIIVMHDMTEQTRDADPALVQYWAGVAD